MKQAGAILASFLDGVSLKEAKEYGTLFSSRTWEELLENCGLGRGISHARIVELERSVLLIEADHPGWVQLFQTKQGELLNAVKRRFPELSLSGIAFRLSPAPLLPEEKLNSAPRRDRELPRQEEAVQERPSPPAADAEKVMCAIKDEKLKAAVQKLEQYFQDRY